MEIVIFRLISARMDRLWTQRRNGPNLIPQFNVSTSSWNVLQPIGLQSVWCNFQTTHYLETLIDTSALGKQIFELGFHIFC